MAPRVLLPQPTSLKDSKGVSKVNKNDLVSTVADKADLSKADAAKAVDGVFDAISGLYPVVVKSVSLDLGHFLLQTEKQPPVGTRGRVKQSK